MNFIAQCIHLQSNSYRSLGAILRFFKNSQHHFKIKRQGCISKTKIACLHQQAQKKVLNLTPSSKKVLQILKEYKGLKGGQFKTIIQGYTHDMSIDKLLQFSISNYGFCFKFLLYHGLLQEVANEITPWGYIHDMSIDKLLQFSLSNYRLLLYFSFIWIQNVQDFLVCLWTFKWGGGSFVGTLDVLFLQLKRQTLRTWI